MYFIILYPYAYFLINHTPTYPHILTHTDEHAHMNIYTHIHI